jgi:hypothetical protein
LGPVIRALFSENPVLGRLAEQRRKTMIYMVSWFENTTPQSVFFNSVGHAKIFLEEAEAQAA